MTPNRRATMHRVVPTTRDIVATRCINCDAVNMVVPPIVDVENDEKAAMRSFPPTMRYVNDNSA
jgi:hypothetical protein